MKNRNNQLKNVLAFTRSFMGVAILFSCELNLTRAALANDTAGVFSSNLKLLKRYDTNILSNESTPIQSWITEINPRVMATTSMERSGVSATYDASMWRYASSKSDNSIDQRFSARGKLLWLERHSLDLSMKVSNLHDERGTAYTTGQGDSITTPDKYRVRSVGVNYRYGHDGAAGRFLINFVHDRKQYTVRRAVTRAFDLDTTDVNATIALRLLPNTMYFTEAGIRQLDYLHDDMGIEFPDNRERRLLFGMKWHWSTLSNGAAKVGAMQKQFSDANIASFTGFTWELSATLLPLPTTSIDIISSGRVEESTRRGNYVDSKSINIVGNQRWSESLANGIRVAIVKSVYQPISQQEGVVAIVYNATYRYTAWLEVGIEFEQRRRYSEAPGLDFERTLLSSYFLAFFG